MVNRLRDFIARHWKPEKIGPPQVDPELDHLNEAQRAAEVLRYSFLSLEWWLSPNGTLREWLKFNGKISSVLLIPAVLVIPLITVILWQVWKWTSWLVGIAGNLIVLPIAILLAAGAIAVTVTILRATLSK